MHVCMMIKIGLHAQDPDRLQAAKSRLFKRYYAHEICALVDTSKQFAGVEQVCDAVDFMLSGQAIGKVVVGMQACEPT